MLPFFCFASQWEAQNLWNFLQGLNHTYGPIYNLNTVKCLLKLCGTKNFTMFFMQYNCSHLKTVPQHSQIYAL